MRRVLRGRKTALYNNINTSRSHIPSMKKKLAHIHVLTHTIRCCSRILSDSICERFDQLRYIQKLVS